MQPGRIEDSERPMVAEVSIIIPTGGRAAALSQTLESIEKYAPRNEIIVIGDRNDEPTRVALSNFPFVRYLESESPSAVVKRNMGISNASSEIMVFVDDDVIIERDWLPNLLRHYSDASVGAVGGGVKVPGLNRAPSFLRTGIIEGGFVIGNWNPTSDATVEVQHLIGCNMSFRREPVLKLDGFDNFFRRCNFREETDLCLRVKELGYRILFDPTASLVHMAIGGRRQDSRWVFYYVRNTLYLFLRYRRHRSSTTKFFQVLIFPPREYARLSGVKVRVTLATPVALISGIIAGYLGFLGHR